jgi:hypothetical protein
MRRSIVAVVIGLGVLGARTQAHHGFTGRYDTDRPYFLVGSVTAISTAPPHPTITFTVQPSAIAPPGGSELPSELTGDLLALDPQFLGRTVSVEFPPVASFYDLGGKVKVGDVIEVIALRNCRAPHQLRSQWVRVPQGREIVKRDGRLSYMARGCAEG